MVAMFPSVLTEGGRELQIKIKTENEEGIAMEKQGVYLCLRWWGRWRISLMKKVPSCAQRTGVVFSLTTCEILISLCLSFLIYKKVTR